MIYLDSSAMLKLVHDERESTQLYAWLGERYEPSRVTSELGRIEVLRAARRLGDQELNDAHSVLADVDLLPLSRHVQDLACHIGEPLLCALDALHLASAVMLGDALTAFVAYDYRLTRAAAAAGLPVAAPGVEE